jgi:hypothetical protein
MDEKPKGYENKSDTEALTSLKRSLKEGRISPDDLKTLENLVERAESSVRNLRAAIVE